MQSASSDASCTITTSFGNVFCKNGVIGDTNVGNAPSVHNSAFLRCNFDANLSLCFRDDDDDDVVDAAVDVDDDDDDEATVVLVVFAVLLELPTLACVC